MVEGGRIHIPAIRVEYDEKTEKEIIEAAQNALEESDGSKHLPFQVIIDSDHAGYVEFGTQGSAKKYDPPRSLKKGRGKGAQQRGELFQNVKAWIKARNMGMSFSPEYAKDSDLDSLAHIISKKIFEEGIPPQPFIRPAIHEIERRLDAGEYYYFTMEDIATDLVELMKNYLRENRTLYGDENILNAISIRKLTFEEARRSIDEPIMIGNTYVPREVWEDPDADMQGDPTRAQYRRAHINDLRW